MNTWAGKTIKNYVKIPLKHPLYQEFSFKIEIDSNKNLGVFLGDNIYLGDVVNGELIFDSSPKYQQETSIKIFSYEPLDLDKSKVTITTLER